MIPIEGILWHYGAEFNDSIERNQKIVCPFHEDTRPSASVNLGEGLFRCFANQGCPEGDAISIVRQMESLDFVDARKLAEKLAGESGPAVSRSVDSGSGLLPRRKGPKSGTRAWRSPWARNRP